MKEFLIALQFLTILPIRIKSKIQDKDYGASLLYFPLVGLLLGILLAGSAFLLSGFSPLLKSALILILLIIITGAIHLDGFADTCDAFYGNRGKEKILEIMRDSHIGAMGVTALVALLIVKFSLIASLENGILWRALIGMTLFSRWAQALSCKSSSYARQNGKAKYFIEHAHKKIIFMGGLFTLLLFFLLMQIKGLVMFFLAMAAIFLFLGYIKKRVGGMTGDTIGALSEFSEVLILLFFNIIVEVS